MLLPTEAPSATPLPTEELGALLRGPLPPRQRPQELLQRRHVRGRHGDARGPRPRQAPGAVPGKSHIARRRDSAPAERPPRPAPRPRTASHPRLRLREDRIAPCQPGTARLLPVRSLLARSLLASWRPSSCACCRADWAISCARCASACSASRTTTRGPGAPWQQYTEVPNPCHAPSLLVMRPCHRSRPRTILSSCAWPGQKRSHPTRPISPNRRRARRRGALAPRLAQCVSRLPHAWHSTCAASHTPGTAPVPPPTRVAQRLRRVRHGYACATYLGKKPAASPACALNTWIACGSKWLLGSGTKRNTSPYVSPSRSLTRSTRGSSNSPIREPRLEPIGFPHSTKPGLRKLRGRQWYREGTRHT
jgi:hypothetical protein